MSDDNALINQVIEKLNPWDGVIGIDPDIIPRHGFDGHLEQAENDPPYGCEGESDVEHWKESQLAPEERMALGHEMLRRWNEYINRIHVSRDAGGLET